MQLPNDLRRLVSIGLSNMYEHPGCHYDWRQRRDFYHHLYVSYGKQGRDMHGWLAVLTAEHVLPIFTSTFPDDLLPQRLVDCSRGIMRGETHPQSDSVDNLQDEGYLSTGIDCMTWRSRIAYNAEYAGNAAYKSLLEARGTHFLLERTEQLINGMEAQTFDMPKGLTPADITDQDIAHLAAYSDTASAAAIASSSQDQKFILNPYKLKTFWEWWTVQAVPRAWELTKNLQQL